MKYSASEVSQMKEQVRNLKSLLDAARRSGDQNRVREIENQIRGLEASISGKYN